VDGAKSSTRPEIVFFDVGDTLLRVDPSWEAVYLRACREHGLRLDQADVERAFRQAIREGFWDEEGPFETTMEASYRRVQGFDQRMMALLGHADLPDAFYRRVADLFVAADAWHVFPETRPVLQALAGAGVRLAVISNWVWGLPELLHELDLARHFEAIVVSARVGYQKPQPEIFRHALDVTRADPARAVHVGDNPAADVRGAQAVGIRPILIDRRDRIGSGNIADQGLTGVALIRRLDELLPLVGLGALARVG